MASLVEYSPLFVEGHVLRLDTHYSHRYTCMAIWPTVKELELGIILFHWRGHGPLFVLFKSLLVLMANLTDCYSAKLFYALSL